MSLQANYYLPTDLPADVETYWCMRSVALCAKIAVDAGTTFEKYIYLTNDYLCTTTTDH